MYETAGTSFLENSAQCFSFWSTCHYCLYTVHIQWLITFILSTISYTRLFPLSLKIKIKKIILTFWLLFKIFFIHYHCAKPNIILGKLQRSHRCITVNLVLYFTLEIKSVSLRALQLKFLSRRTRCYCTGNEQGFVIWVDSGLYFVVTALG